MKMRKTLIGAGLGLLAIVGLARSQTVTVPQVSTVQPFKDLYQVIPNGAPVVGNVYAQQSLVTNVYGYYKSQTTLASAFVYKFGTNVTYAGFYPTGTLAWGYIYLAAAPSDGARNCFFSIAALTAVTMYAGTTTQTLNNPVTALTANTGACYLYSASNTSWDRD